MDLKLDLKPLFDSFVCTQKLGKTRFGRRSDMPEFH